MDAAHTKDYLKHLEKLGQKDSAEYKRIQKKEVSGTLPKPTKK